MNYACNSCYLKATKDFDLKRHKQFVHKDGRYDCNNCGYKASLGCHPWTHQKSIHKDSKYACNKCDPKASRGGSLQEHQQSIHEGMLYACDKCNYEETIKFNIKAHTQSYHECLKTNIYNNGDCVCIASVKFEHTTETPSAIEDAGKVYNASNKDNKDKGEETPTAKKDMKLKTDMAGNEEEIDSNGNAEEGYRYGYSNRESDGNKDYDSSEKEFDKETSDQIEGNCVLNFGDKKPVETFYLEENDSDDGNDNIGVMSKEEIYITDKNKVNNDGNLQTAEENEEVKKVIQQEVQHLARGQVLQQLRVGWAPQQREVGRNLQDSGVGWDPRLAQDGGTAELTRNITSYFGIGRMNLGIKISEKNDDEEIESIEVFKKLSKYPADHLKEPKENNKIPTNLVMRIIDESEVDKECKDVAFLHCHKCDLPIYPLGKYNRHVKYYHEKALVCHECGQRFTLTNGLVKHRLNHHKYFPKNCEYCGHFFTTKEELKDHVKFQHKEVTQEKLVAYEMHGKFVKHEQHTEPVHDKIGGDFLCDQCGKNIESKAKLEFHSQVHPGDCAYKCKECGHGFMRSELMLECENTHAGVFQLNCTDCDYKRNEMNVFKNHMMNHIPFINEGLKDACEECDYENTAEVNIKSHPRLFHEDLKYSCNKYNFTETSCYNLKNHSQSIHDCLYCACDKCQETFVSSHEFQKHVEKEHLSIRLSENKKNLSTKYGSAYKDRG